MKRAFSVFLSVCLLVNSGAFLTTVGADEGDAPPAGMFDDRLLLKGYAEHYVDEPKEILLARIKDEALDPFKGAAAVHVFRERFSSELVSREKRILEKTFIRRLNRADSPFLQVELMMALCQLDRYKYFDTMAPALVLKLDHYNSAVNELASEGLEEIIKNGNNRAREARIIFNTLRKTLFLSRKRLANVKEPGPQLKQKFHFLRWAIKVLGNQEIRKLPKEVIGLL